MYKKGDKFVMEIDEVIMFDEKVWYKTKGPNSFIIDQRGLDSLSQLVDGVDKFSELKGYSKGYAEGTNIVKEAHMKEENRSVGGGIGFCGLLTIVFIVLKLCKIISWSWVWVFAPSWIPAALVILFMLCVFLLGVKR